MAEPVRARRLTQEEGRKLQQLVRRGKRDSVRVRRALIIMASASGTPVPAIARLRMFTMASSNHPNHTVLAREVQKYLRWRNANARHPDVLAAHRRERARVRSERQHRWGRPRTKAQCC
ncbi:hypothetical protein O7610_21010 [Solwaraspora sp. WMMA2065]|nr:hypothetical protein [Solwaraspora sp. WMMA2065]WJK33177.1 hypothetical protein O7610_21010 [Solwaraspora sp. WMMA2065]